MAHYARLDANNIVTRVIVGPDETNGSQNWETYFSYLLGGVWRRTSYNTFEGVHSGGKEQFRGNYAGVGYKYHADIDAFVAPQPYPSWTLNTETFSWDSPVPYPDDEDNQYEWNEEAQTWDLI